MNLNALKKLNKDQLVRLVKAIAGLDDGIDAIIEQHLLLAKDAESLEDNSGHVSPAVSMIIRQMEIIRAEEDFIDYHDSSNYSCRLDSLLLDINTLVREEDPVAALTLTETFIFLHESVFERCDDSDGDIGCSFRDAMDQWLDIAVEVRAINPAYCDWPKKLREFFDSNEYGVLDGIIANSYDLLTDEELLSLAWQFEKEARQALKNPKESGYNFEAARACIGIESVAEALGDIALYEKATLLTSPTPNTLQIDSIVRFALHIRAFERVEYWLDQPQWEEDLSRHKHLCHQYLMAKGAVDELKESLRKDFQQTPSPYQLEVIWTLANEQEKIELSEEVITLSQQPVNDEYSLCDIIEMLQLVERVDKAADVLLSQHQLLNKTRYNAVLDWMAHFSKTSHPLACVICYRYLLMDLLNRGYSKAYHHGARYFHKLLELDQQDIDYQGLVGAQEFIRQVQEKHWRKRSFWAAADYPNKP